MTHNPLDKMALLLEKNTGKTLEQWIKILEKSKKSNHKENVQFLQNEHGLGFNYADLIVHKANKTDSGSQSAEDLIEGQYRGKEHLKPIYDKLIGQIKAWGNDIEVAPKKAYVSLRRKKQFACLKPATKTRFEIEVILKGQAPQGVLESIDSPGAMCTHRIKVESEKELSQEIYKWIKMAYAKAV